MAKLECHDFGRKKASKNSIVAPTLKYDFKGGAAHENGMMQRGDILIAVDENPVTGLSHSDVILFMSNAARNGVVKLTLRRENDITRTNSNSTCKLEIIYIE